MWKFWLARSTTRFAAIGLAGLLGSGSPGAHWVAPLEGGFTGVLRTFERPADRFAAGHRGVDLPAKPGQPVRSIGPGVITFVGQVAGTPSVTVEHQRVRSSYLPVRAQVRIGDRVQTGTIIGTVASPAHCPATCLHLGLRRPAWDAQDAQADPYLDPIAWIQRTPVLKPVPRSLP